MTANSQAEISALRHKAVNLFREGVAAADPYQAVKRCLKHDGKQLQITLDHPAAIHSKPWSKIHIIAFGKAACPMLQAVLDVIPSHFVSEKSIAVTNYDNVTHISGAQVIGADHPLPDEVGFNAAKQCAELAQQAQAGELVLVLVSGGGSALIPYPVNSVSLQEKIQTTQLLLASGATINEINCVRKHLSQLKGGGLARMAAPAEVCALILSDVIGDDLSAIASGPTVPDATTFADAINILNNKDIWHQVSDSVRHYLIEGSQGNVKETAKPDESFFANTHHSLIGSNGISVDAITKAAQAQGFDTILYSDMLCGEARNQAEKLVKFTKEQQQNNRPLAILAGGETTVTLKGNGKGGRNQEMALAFAIQAQQQALSGNWVFLSGGTDGRDGPTDAAGGLVDSGTIERINAVGEAPAKLLANNDSYTALNLSHDLLVTGATGTNVADLQVLLIN